MRNKLAEASRLLELEKLDAAEKLLRQTLKMEGDGPLALNLLGIVASRRQRYEEALALMQSSLILRPDTGEFHHNIAAVYRMVGDLQKAVWHYERAISLRPDYAEAYFNYAATRSFSESHPMVLEVVRRAEAAPTAEDRCFLNFAAGKMLADVGDYQEAFAHYQRGNALRGVAMDWDAHDRLWSETTAVFTPEFLSQQLGHGYVDPTPVFVVGMPRSGTTWVDRVLACHPRIWSAGELPDVRSIAAAMGQHATPGSSYPNCLKSVHAEVFAGFGAAYVRRIRELNGQAERIVDRMPHNCWYLGLVALILPQSRIIHCRRAPLDVCISNFFQRYRHGQEWSYALEDIARYYVDYRKIMEHWESLLPAAICEVRYEELVSQPAAVLQRMWDFCGVEGEPECLEFSKGPARSARTGCWQPYQRHLAPLVRRLTDAGVPIE